MRAGITGSVANSFHLVINPFLLMTNRVTAIEDSVSPESDGRSPIAIGFERASRIFVAGTTFLVPILAGHWVDRVAGSAPLGLLVGTILGLMVGMVQLVRVARGSSPRP